MYVYAYILWKKNQKSNLFQGQIVFGNPLSLQAIHQLKKKKKKRGSNRKHFGLAMAFLLSQIGLDRDLCVRHTYVCVCVYEIYDKRIRETLL